MLEQLIGGLWGAMGGTEQITETAVLGCMRVSTQIESVLRTYSAHTLKRKRSEGKLGCYRFSLLRFVGFAGLLMGARAQDTGIFTPFIGLRSLNGTTGYVLNGEQSGDSCGYSVSSAGDVNGDGLSDILIGAYGADPPGRSLAGKSYVVYGNSNPLPGGILELSTLDGTRGFVLNGANARDYSGWSVSSAGDVNGDGLSDIVIGAYQAAPGGRNEAGKTYVVYGNKSLIPGGMLDLSILNGTKGFVLNGEQIGDKSGYFVSGGDVNGDGFSDILIGAPSADPGGRSFAGRAYVVYGHPRPFSQGMLELSSLNGTVGFILNGDNASDGLGWSGSSASDVNGDGIADIVIGAFGADSRGRGLVGKTYVVFGQKDSVPGGTLELSTLNGTMGFVLIGEQSGDYSGYSVSTAKDVNGDGRSDIVVGAYRASPGGRSQAGKTYVVFGRKVPFLGGSLDLSTLNGTNGFVLNGDQADDNSGSSVSSAGDVNGDGLSDILIGSYLAEPNPTHSLPGKTYVVFGSKSPFPQGKLDLSTLDRTMGFVINDHQPFDKGGGKVSSAGDVNGDGVSDFMVGAYLGDVASRSNAGKTYLVYGHKQLKNSTQAPPFVTTLSSTHSLPFNSSLGTTLEHTFNTSQSTVKFNSSTDFSTPSRSNSSSNLFSSKLLSSTSAGALLSSLPAQTNNLGSRDSRDFLIYIGIGIGASALGFSVLTGSLLYFRKQRSKSFQGDGALPMTSQNEYGKLHLSPPDDDYAKGDFTLV